MNKKIRKCTNEMYNILCRLPRSKNTKENKLNHKRMVN